MDDFSRPNDDLIRAKRDLASSLETVKLCHSKIRKPLTKLMAILEDQLDGIAPSGAFVIGEAGVGKTTLMRLFMEKAIQSLNVSPDQMIQISLQGSLNLTGVYSTILQDMGDWRSSNGTNQQKLQRIVELCKHRHIEVLLIDEVHHLWQNEHQSDTCLAEIANAFKAIVDHGKTSVMVFGVEAALDLWREDDQIRRRMAAPMTIAKFALGDEDDRDEWHGIMERFHSALADFSIAVDIDKTEFADRMLVSCNGMLSRATQLIGASAMRAMRQIQRGETAAITHDSMQDVAALKLTDEFGQCNGFDMNMAQIRSRLNPSGSENALAPRPPTARQIISKRPGG